MVHGDDAIGSGVMNLRMICFESLACILEGIEKA